MGRHPCSHCDSEDWDYSETHCPQSQDDGPCEYWDGNEICPTCFEKLLVDCNRCSLSGCYHCIKKHCGNCKAKLCDACRDYGEEDDEEEDDEDVEREPVEEVTFPLCGHKGCNGFVEVGAVLDYCRSCTTISNEQDKQTKLKIQKQLEKDDAIVLKTMQQRFKSESLKKTVTNWYSSCAIPEYDVAEPAQKKLKVNDSVIDLTSETL